MRATLLLIVLVIVFGGQAAAETETFVTQEQFEEFDKRMAERFQHAADSRAQGFAAVNQRIDDLRLDMQGFRMEMQALRLEMQADMRQTRGWLIGLLAPVVLAVVGAIVTVVVKWGFSTPRPPEGTVTEPSFSKT